MKITAVLVAALLAAEPAMSMPKNENKKKNIPKAIPPPAAVATVATTTTNVVTVVPVATAVEIPQNADAPPVSITGQGQAAPIDLETGTPSTGNDLKDFFSSNGRAPPQRYVEMMRQYFAQRQHDLHVRMQNVDVSLPGEEKGSKRMNILIRKKRLIRLLDPNDRLSALRDSAFLREEVENIVREFELKEEYCRWDMDVIQHVIRVQSGQMTSTREEEKVDKSTKKKKEKKKTQKEEEQEALRDASERLIGKVPCNWEIDDDLLTLSLLARKMHDDLTLLDAKAPADPKEIPSKEQLRDLIPEYLPAGTVGAGKPPVAGKTVAGKKKYWHRTKDETTNKGQEEEKAPKESIVKEEGEAPSTKADSELDDINAARQLARELVSKHYKELDTRNEDLYKKMAVEVETIVKDQRKRSFKALQRAYTLLLRSLTRKTTIDLLTYNHLFHEQEQNLKGGAKAGKMVNAVGAARGISLIDKILVGVANERAIAESYVEKAIAVLPLKQRGTEVNVLEDSYLKQDGCYNALKMYLPSIVTQVAGQTWAETSDLKLERLKLLALGSMADMVTQQGLQLRWNVEKFFLTYLQKEKVESPVASQFSEVRNTKDLEPIEFIQDHGDQFPSEVFLSVWANFLRPNWFSMEAMNIASPSVEEETNLMKELLEKPDGFFHDASVKPLLEGVLENKKAALDARKVLSDVIEKSSMKLITTSRDSLVELLGTDEKRLQELSGNVQSGSTKQLQVGENTKTPVWMQKHTVWFDAVAYFNAILGNDKDKQMELRTAASRIQIQKKTLKNERDQWLPKFFSVSPVTPESRTEPGQTPPADADLVTPLFKEYIGRWKHVDRVTGKAPEPPLLEKARLDNAVAAYVLDSFPKIKAEVKEMLKKSRFPDATPTIERFAEQFKDDMAVIEEKVKSVSSEVTQILRSFVETASFQENVLQAKEKLKDFLSEVAGPMNLVLSYKPTEGTELSVAHPDMFLNQFIGVKYLLSNNYEKIALDMDEYLRSVATEAKRVSLGDKSSLAEISKIREALAEVLDAANPARLGVVIEALISNTKNHVDGINTSIDKQKKSSDSTEDPRVYWTELADIYKDLGHLVTVIDLFKDLANNRGQTWQGYKSTRDTMLKIQKTIEDIRKWLVEKHPNHVRGAKPPPLGHDHMDDPKTTAAGEKKAWDMHVAKRIELFGRLGTPESELWRQDLARKDLKNQPQEEWEIARGLKYKWDKRIDNVRDQNAGI